MDKSFVNRQFKQVVEVLLERNIAKSKGELADKFGISSSKFSEILNERMNVGADLLASIVENYPDISPDWLLTGNGKMLKSDLPVAHHSTTGDGIPLISIEAMAGFARGDMQVLERDCERYIVPLFHEAEFLIPVKGSSMIPKYHSGDIVACKHLPLNDLFFQWNNVYVLDTVQGALIKRIKEGSDSEHLLIVSENKDYQPFELRRDQIRSVALVIGVIRLD